MSDSDIISLYWDRDESAISESARQYSGYCYSIAYNILGIKEDSDECVNDTWLKVWNTIPPQRPDKLSSFLGKITRNLALDKFKAKTTQKRGGSEIMLVLDELEECVPSDRTVEHEILYTELVQIINCFLRTLPERECNVFLSRYWYGNPIKRIAATFSMKEGNVKVSLFRSRIKLKDYLIKEEVFL